MSTINRKPFIKDLIDSLTIENITTLGALMDGGGNQTPILRTMSDQPTASRPNISVADKGIRLCNLQLEFSLFEGYLIYNNDYCVLIHFTDSQVLTMFSIDVAKRELSVVDEYLDVNELRSELNDAIPAEETEAVQAVQSALDDGDLKIKAENIDSEEAPSGKVLTSNGDGTADWKDPLSYSPFPSDWTVNGTIKEFCDDINADENAIDGMAYVGELNCSDLPTGLSNVDTKVEIISGSGTSNKVIHVICTSGNVSPYRWEYTYWNSGENLSGWVTFGGEAVSLNATSGTLSDVEYQKISSDNCIIKYDNYIYYKINETSSYIYYQRTAEVTSVSTYAGTVDRYVITITKSNKAYSLSSSSVSLNRVIANPVLSGSEQELEGINVGGTSFKNRAKVTANPTLVGSEAELTGLEIGNTKFKMPELVKLDGVKFAFDNNADYTLSSLTNFASYARVAGSMMIFVVSFDITKNNAVTAPITVGKFFGLSDELFAKLVGGTYLVEENTKAYVDGSFTSVDAATALQKTTVSGVNYISLLLDTANLVQGTTYHVRHMSTFLLTDNIGGIDSVLSNNSWDIIEEVASLGQTANYWNVGDTKTDLGTDGNTRTFRIVEIENDGSIVFEQVELEASNTQWNPSTNLDSDNCYNDYYISDMRNTHLPATLLKYSSALQGVITTTNVKVATNGNNGTILTLTDKLFLEAEKEVWTSRNYSRTEEWNALTTFSYWTTHTASADHIKYRPNGGSANYWWLRSPRSGGTSYVCDVDVSGNADLVNASSTYRFAPCFRIGAAQTGGLGPWSPTPSADSTLENNSWDTIKSVCEAGDAANYWSVGDTKTDVGTDGVTRTFRIVDMSGLYGKHVVFEQVGLEGTDGTGATGVAWDADNLNDYLASDMNVTVLPGVITRYSSALQGALTNTTVKVAENGNSATIVNVTNKLFLEAEKEVFGSATYSRSEEASALTQYAYYTTHNTAEDRKKYRAGASSASNWWLRSPGSGSTDYVCFVSSDGSAFYYGAIGTYRFAPCFSF